MICQKCQGQNADNVNFCIHCGAPLRNTCPNCGTVNAAGARFCTNCGRSFVTAPPPAAPPVMPQAVTPQPIVVVKQGMPGWVWAVIGILIGVIVIGGLGLTGLLPWDFLKSTPVTQLPAVEAPISSTKTPAPLASVESYCPETGGVILYWDAGFKCANETDDPGYRYRVGDGAQDVNTGKFDNQASAIYIPAGWSVRLYEAPDQYGRSVCFNSPVANFEDRGNFPNSIIPINDNISSMEVFADGTCGEDLAAGAEPAPWPRDEERIDPLGEANPAAAGYDGDTACHTDSRCGCMPAVLDEVDYGPGDGEYDWELDRELFQERFIDSVTLDEEYFTVKFKPESGKLADWLSQPGMEFNIELEGWPRIEYQQCFFEIQADGGISCKVPIPKDAANKTDWVTDWGIYVDSETATGFEWCSKVLFGDTWNENINPAVPTPHLQCTDPRKPQVCGDKCCSEKDSCVQQGGVFRCKESVKEPEPKQCDPSDSCCSNPSLPGCP